MNPTGTARVDLHCHSTASEVSKLGVQRSLGLPECATPPQEVYELAKRRGMDLVTITDHDTIEGCLSISGFPDAFISEELTVWFRDEPQAVHVLCLGITPDDHEWLQAHNGDLEACASYLHENEIACSLAHPFYAVEAPLTPEHRRRLAQLFPVWETRNGSRARELNMPAAIYIETHGGTGTGGSDDHAGVDIGRTYTETPLAATPEEFLRHIREGRAEAHGQQGSAAKWAHTAMALATRALLLKDAASNGYANGNRGLATLDPGAALKMAERVMSEGGIRHGSVAGDLGPGDARALLAAFTDSIGLDLHGRALIDHMQSEDFSHAELERRARRAHERKLHSAVEAAVERFSAEDSGQNFGAAALDTGTELFEAAIPALPYAPAAAFLGKEKQKLTPDDGPKRVALVSDAIGAVHGVSHTIEQLRELGVPGHEVEVIGTDRNVDRRLPAAAEVEVPFYAGLEIGVPSLPGMVEVLAEGRFDLVHVTAPGPAAVIATLIARIMELPVIGSWHTELGAYAGLRSSSRELEHGVDAALSIFYRQCARVLSPSPASDDSLARLGVERDRIGRWGRGVDTSRFDPKLRDPDGFRTTASSASRPGAADEIKVIYVGRQTKEKGAELLADSFLRAHEADPRLHLLLGGGGPEEGYLRERLGDSATFLGWLDGDDLPRAYASADIFLFTSRTDTFGQVLVEAGASGLPVVAVAEGGPASIVADGETGRLCEPDADLIAAALLQLADAPAYRAKLGRQGLTAARARTWEAAMAQLEDGYAAVLEPEPSADRIALAQVA